jgi:hypothetical protein
MPRPYCNVIVWSPPANIISEAFFVVHTHDTIREIKSHRNVTPAQFQEYVSFSMFLGKRVTFDVCNAEFQVTQRAEFQRTPEATD